MPNATEYAYASAVSLQEDASIGVQQVCSAVGEQLGQSPDLVLAFVSADRAEEMDTIAKQLSAEFQDAVVLGCTAESLVGVKQEIEGRTSVSLWAAVFPGAECTPLRVSFERTPEGGVFLGMPSLEQWPDEGSILLLGDPYSFPADALLERWGGEFPEAVIAGGMASGAAGPNQARVMLGDTTYADGAVAVMLSGVPIRTVVSQGCRPIGSPFVVTKAERNIIYQLGGKNAYEELRQIYEELPTREQRMVQQGLHVGRVVNEYQDAFSQGDFLVRNVVGINAEDESIAIGDYVRVGQTVQFQIRDHETADAEMRQLLAQGKHPAPGGALLFTCNGRGTRLFPEPHHDALAIEESFGSIPLAGFFAAGEIGPVGGKNFTHGFTASVVLFPTGKSGKNL